MQLGALAAAGYSPRETFSMTWKQIGLWSGMVRAYHLDLTGTLFRGKSPTMEAARKEGVRRRDVEAMAEALARLAPEHRAGAETAHVDRLEMMKVANFKRAGFGVNTVVEPALAQIDLFKEFARRKALAAAEARGGRDR